MLEGFNPENHDQNARREYVTVIFGLLKCLCSTSEPIPHSHGEELATKPYSAVVIHNEATHSIWSVVITYYTLNICAVIVLLGSSGGVVVKLLACGARGPGFDSRSRRYNFRDWLSPASKT